MPDSVPAALRDTLISPNESDSNFEAANVVDGLFAIARSINRLSNTLEWLAFGDDVRTIQGDRVIVPMEAAPLNRLATALEHLAKPTE